MRLEQTVSESANAPPMRWSFRALLSALALTESLTPEKLLPDLTADALIEKAGVPVSPGAREGLRQLTASLAKDTKLTMFGRLSVHWDFIRLMRNAAQVQNSLAGNPAIGLRPVTAPIFILGLPRSGTTFLHGLLACDPDNLVPRAWQTIYPEPRNADFDASRDRRAKIVNRQFKFFGGISPEFFQLHPIDADGPQECSEITAHVFQSLRFDTTFRVPDYQAWIDDRGHQEAFVFHRKFLQVLQHGTAGNRWLLKCPDHSFCLDAILKIYPDARFVVVHRDPMRVFASVAHLTEVLRRPFLKNIDPLEIGAQVTERWIEGAKRLVAFDQRADIDSPRKIHIHYDALAAAPMAAIARIYQHFDLPFSATAGTAISQKLNTRPAGGYGGERRYVLDRFGINPQRLAPHFSAYLDYFRISI
jgi:hypothetical protein